MMMQSRWSSVLQPVINQPINFGNQLNNISLVSGDNVINHLLGRTPQGWFIVDVNAAVQIYRSAAFNSSTLTLNSSGTATVSLFVY